MSFSSKKNADMLYEIISEEFKNIDYANFNKLFLEFGQASGNSQLPLMEMNKRFIRTIQSSITTRTPSFVPSQQIQNQNQNNYLSTTMPSRPQGSRSKIVSFDEELELHRQHFQQFASPPPPTPPVFKDETSQPSSDLSILMQKAMSERKYDIVSPQPQQSSVSRKLHIGSFVEDDKHKEDLIDIDKLANNIEQQQPPKSAFDFFSKLKPVKKEPEPEPEEEPLIMRQETLTYSSTQNEEINMNMSTNTLEELTQTVNELAKELKETKGLVVALSAELATLKQSISTS